MKWKTEVEVDVKPDYKGHKNLADMVSTHIHVWRKLLEDAKFDDFENCVYWEHELKALSEIEQAVNKELGK